MAPSALQSYYVDTRISSTTFSFSHISREDQPPIPRHIVRQASSSESEDYDFPPTPPSQNRSLRIRPMGLETAVPGHRRHRVDTKEGETTARPRTRIVCSIVGMLFVGCILLTAILLVTLSAVVKIRYTSERCKLLDYEKQPTRVLSEMPPSHRQLLKHGDESPRTLNVDEFAIGVHDDRGWNISSWPLDLRVNHFRVLGTRNSYHLPSQLSIGSHLYSHAPLYDQLGTYDKGVRALELDVHLVDDTYVVYHLQLVDDHTTCYCLAECLGHVRQWSNDYPYHFPVSIFIEIKAKFWEDVNTGLSGVSEKHVEALNQHIRDAIPADRLITPASVLGNYSSFEDALQSEDAGWPALKDSLGKFLFFWLDDVYDLASNVEAVTRDPSMRDHLFFMGSSDLTLPYVALAVINDPYANTYSDQMRLARERNLLIRTIADNPSGEEPNAERFQLVLAESPNFVTTDFDCTQQVEPELSTSPTSLPTQLPTPPPEIIMNNKTEESDEAYCQFLPTTRPFECNPIYSTDHCFTITFFPPLPHD